MITIFASLFLIFQDEEVVSSTSNWWKSLFVGEVAGKYWLWLFGCTLISGVICYTVYTTMLYNLVGNNYHPANFRRLMYAVFLFLVLICAYWIFWDVFGFPMLVLLGLAVIILGLVFFFTKRKVAQPQS